MVAEQVGQGRLWAGLTDNDDVAEAQKNDLAIEMVLPDQETFGTLTIPTSMGLVANAPHAAEGKKLIDYLLSAEVEKKLIEATFAKYSVRDATAILEGREK